MSERMHDPESHYDRVTGAWTLLLGEDLHYGLFSTEDDDLPTATRALTDRMVAAAQLVPGLRLLDVGCGTGAPACHLVSAHEVQVTGVTTSLVGVEAARARAQRAGLDALATFEQRDGMNNRFPGGSFDRVWALESSHLMRDRRSLIAECARVLRPGGRLVLCDIVLRRAMPFEEVKRLRRPLALLREVFGDARMEPLGEYVALARDCGLQIDEELDLTDATRMTFQRWRENAERFRAEVVDALGPSELQQFVDSCDVLEAFWRDGTLGYGLLAAVKP